MSPKSQPAREVVDTTGLPWVSRKGVPGQVKLLHMNDDFTYIALFRAPANVVGPAHVHVGPTEVFFLAGQAETVAGVAGKGCWVLEPAGAMHRASKSLSDVIALDHVNGPMMVLDAQGAAPPVVFGEALAAFLEYGDSLLEKTPPELTALLFPEDYDSGVVQIESLPWQPSGYEGVSIKVLNAAENGRFTVLTKAEDGSVVPSRRYTAPGDFYVLQGEVCFDDAKACADHWVYEPAGRVEGPINHAGETWYVGTHAGAFLDLSCHGGIDRVIDAQMLRELSGEFAAAAVS